MSDVGVRVSDVGVERLKRQRDRPSVLKLQLAVLRSRLPDGLIFIFEGDDDKRIYYQWVRRIDPELSYEPFPCNGKDQVLALHETLRRDLTGLSSDVYFFVDRDFDDLKGHEPSDSLYMTDAYAVENYLVNRAVLESTLTNEFHCHARPDIRARILSEFDGRFNEFLSVTYDLNFRLFCARRLSIEIKGGVRLKINEIATISLGSVTASRVDVARALPLTREPTTEEQSELKPLFDELWPALRYRGKFALAFFEKWLFLLSECYAGCDPDWFNEVNKRGKVRQQELTIGTFASKSSMPAGLEAFVRSMNAAKAASPA